MYSPADWIAAAARRFPDREALRVGDEAFTYAELDQRVGGAAKALRERGVGPGGRVATLLPNGLASALMPHAALRLGAVLVPISTRLSGAEIRWMLDRGKPVLLVADDVSREAGSLEVPRLAPDELLVPRAARDDEHGHPDAGSPLAIIYTSGTTGRPKGAVLTVGNFAASAAASAAILGVHEDDRWLAVLPLFHVGGLSILLRSAMQGTGVVVHERFDADAVNRAIDEGGITIASLVAVMLERVLDARGDRPFPKRFRCALVGGGPVSRPLLERCLRAKMPIAPTYGLTEAASQVATLLPAEAAKHAGAAGRALPGTQLRIDGSDEGEILVSGPTVMAGYLDDPDATSKAIRDGWLHTGDIGYLDDDGFLFVLDRRDDLIVTGGENVYPAEVEGVLASHPDVEEVAVVGTADATWGQRVTAIIRLAPNARADSAALERFCRERLAGFKVPRELRFVSEPLPRTASGKLQRSRLRDLQ